MYLAWRVDERYDQVPTRLEYFVEAAPTLQNQNVGVAHDDKRLAIEPHKEEGAKDSDEHEGDSRSCVVCWHDGCVYHGTSDAARGRSRSVGPPRLSECAKRVDRSVQSSEQSRSLYSY